MGVKMVPNYANIFMSVLENSFLESQEKLPPV